MVTRRISTLKRPKHALRSAGKATIASKAPPSSLPTVILDAWSRSSAIPPSASLSSVRKFQICLARLSSMGCEKVPLADEDRLYQPGLLDQDFERSKEKKDQLLGVYMAAVHTHADTVGLLKAVRDQPQAFSSALKKAKEAYAECGRVKSEL